MEFALQYEIQVPRPWGPNSESDVYFEIIEQIKEGERVGFNAVWMVEHHFLPEFSHCSAPEVFLAAVAQHTSTIRIGHGVVLAPPPFNHPVRVAERIGALDILSRGRVEFGIGRSITQAELGGFSIDPGDSRPMMLEALDLIPRFWLEDGPVGFEGKYISMPPRQVVPRPVQRPHPPMWMACTSPDSYVMAGELGLGVLGFGNAVDPPGVKRRLDAYRDGLTRAQTNGRAINDRAGIFLMAFCAETDAEAEKIASAPMAKYLDDTFAHFLFWGTGADLPPGYEWYAQAAKKVGAASQAQKFDYLRDNHMLLCGSPQTIIDTLKSYEHAGIDQLLMGSQYAGMPHDAIMNSIQLMGKEVLPHFQ
jgi:alkanesulfonate monooxygenase SsuD/methylene tetrahydromethanopterin reductase-like flavin-dependent oxidoreductase (luciferase family)